MCRYQMVESLADDVDMVRGKAITTDLEVNRGALHAHEQLCDLLDRLAEGITAVHAEDLVVFSQQAGRVRRATRQKRRYGEEPAAAVPQPYPKPTPGRLDPQLCCTVHLKR